LIFIWIDFIFLLVYVYFCFIFLLAIFVYFYLFLRFVFQPKEKKNWGHFSCDAEEPKVAWCIGLSHFFFFLFSFPFPAILFWISTLIRSDFSWKKEEEESLCHLIYVFFFIFLCHFIFMYDSSAINLLIFVSMRKYFCEFLLTGVLVFKFRGRLGLFHTSNFPSLLVTYTLMTMCTSSLKVWKILCLSVCLFLVVFLFSKIFQKIK